MKESKNIEEALELAAPKLSAEAHTKLWQAIEAKINAPVLIVSPYSFTFFNLPKKTMAPVMLVLVVLLGAGGTVAASESAKPGDMLFPLDLAMEHVRLSLVIKDDTRVQLQSMFAEERFDELKDILEEEQKSSVGVVNVTDFIIDEVATFEAEADVFIDVTVVTIEMADQKTVFTTKATSTTAIVADIAARFSVSTARVAAVLRVDVENRISRPSDTLRLSKLGEDRVGVAVSTILDFLEDEDFDDAVRTASLLRLVTKLDEIHGGVIDDRVRIDKKANRIEIHNNHNDSRIEIEHGKTRIRVKEQDGEVRADDNHSDSSRAALEVEADVYAAVTIVKVEVNDQKTTFETTAKTEAAIAAEVVTRFGVTMTDVLHVLDIETEDGAYPSGDASSSGSDDGGNDERRSSDDNRNDSNSDDKSGRVEKFEARVESGIAEVRVVYNGKELEFEATYITKAALVAEVVLKTGMSTASLDAALDLEVRD